MRSLAALLFVIAQAAACSFDGSGDLPGNGGSDAPETRADAGADGDAQLGCQSFSSLVDTCSLAASEGLNLDIPGEYIYQTTDGILTDPNGEAVEQTNNVFPAAERDLRIMLIESLFLGEDSTLRARGNLPLGIVAYGAIEIAGQINVGSGGAGDRANCGLSSGLQGADRSGGAGGGGGGGFQGAGGNGGQGDADSLTPSAIGPGGSAAPHPLSPIGGCRGGKGGAGEDPGGNGGRGGGAIYLAASSTATISGSIQAGGQGGRGGDESGVGSADGGGGGGGSGGYISIEAPTIALTGVLAANGGGGGEGAGSGQDGDNGDSGQLSALPAIGGAGDSDAGSSGATGGAGAELDGASVEVIEDGGGGGGGGGAGFIFVAPVQTLGGTVSPPALSPPAP